MMASIQGIIRWSFFVIAIRVMKSAPPVVGDVNSEASKRITESEVKFLYIPLRTIRNASLWTFKIEVQCDRVYRQYKKIKGKPPLPRGLANFVLSMYKHLTREQRCAIYLGLQKHETNKAIAQAIEVSVLFKRIIEKAWVCIRNTHNSSRSMPGWRAFACLCVRMLIRTGWRICRCIRLADGWVHQLFEVSFGWKWGGRVAAFG